MARKKTTATPPITHSTPPDELGPYLEAKRKFPGCLLLFRMGDFYELFFEDAQVASQILGLTLSWRGKSTKGVPMCGFPYYCVEGFLKKLIASGQRVAVCEKLAEIHGQHYPEASS